MWMMLQQPEPDDYVIATGETHSIEELVERAFAEIGVDDWRRYVRQDPKFFRPAEVDLLIGDASKARDQLGWQPEVTFPELISMMVTHDLAYETARLKNR
jgi:GDPmannose 4,6-dehydratase